MSASRQRRVPAPAAAVRAQHASHPPPPAIAPSRSRLPLVGALLVGAWLERLAFGLPPVLANGVDLALVVASAVVVMLAYRRSARRRLERARAERAGPQRPPARPPRSDETTSSRPPAAAG